LAISNPSRTPQTQRTPNREPGAGSIYTGQHEDSVYNILNGILFFSVVIMAGLVLGCAKVFFFHKRRDDTNTQEGSA